MNFIILIITLISSAVFCDANEHELKSRKIPSITRSIKDGIATYRNCNDGKVIYTCIPKEQHYFFPACCTLVNNTCIVVQNSEDMILYMIKRHDGHTFATTSDDTTFCHKEVNEDETISYRLDNGKLVAVIKVINKNKIIITDYTGDTPQTIHVTRVSNFNVPKVDLIKFSASDMDDNLFLFCGNMLQKINNKSELQACNIIFKFPKTNLLDISNRLLTITEILLFSIIRLLN